MADMAASQRLIDALRDPEAWPHPVTDIRVEETHISWVLLTGSYAYKIKKPVDFGFLDFSTLARRDHCCHEELRLNRRLAPELYLDVVRITAGPDGPRVGGEGAAIEMAVQMRQFDPRQQLDRVLERDELTPGDLEQVGREVAAFHARAPATEAADGWGEPASVWQPIVENFTQVRSAAADIEGLPERLDRLQQRAAAHHESLQSLLAERRDSARVRECHGDLHLSNLARIGTGIRAFDCIEFAPSLRWIDVCSDVAFLYMDLLARRRPELAWRFMNSWLAASGDYEAVRLLDMYAGYRSMVRAKVAALQRTQQTERSARADLEARLMLHLELTEQLLAARAEPAVILIGGLSGSGKTHLARQLADRLGAVHLRSDVERKRLHGLGELDASDAALDGGIYTEQASAATHDRLGHCASEVLAGGHPVIVDATFIDRAQRRRMLAQLGAAAADATLLWCDAPRALRVERLQQRRGDASEADVEVMTKQEARLQPVADDEALRTLVIDTGAGSALDQALSAVSV